MPHRCSSGLCVRVVGPQLAQSRGAEPGCRAADPGRTPSSGPAPSLSGCALSDLGFPFRVGATAAKCLRKIVLSYFGHIRQNHRRACVVCSGVHHRPGWCSQHGRLRRSQGVRGRPRSEPGRCRPRNQVRSGMTRIGVVVGLAVPPAGSTVRPSSSPGISPVANSGRVRPPLGAGSRPAGRVRRGLISQAS